MMGAVMFSLAFKLEDFPHHFDLKVFSVDRRNLERGLLDHFLLPFIEPGAVVRSIHPGPPCAKRLLWRSPLTRVTERTLNVPIAGIIPGAWKG